MSGEAYAPGMSAVKPSLNVPPDFPKPATFWADYFGVSPRTIQDWTDKYSIPYYLPGRERFISPADMMAYMPKIKPQQE